MPYRRRPDDTVWHTNADCWNWPGGSYEGRAELPEEGVVCFECTERRRVTPDYTPPLPVRPRAISVDPLTRVSVRSWR